MPVANNCSLKKFAISGRSAWRRIPLEGVRFSKSTSLRMDAEAIVDHRE